MLKAPVIEDSSVRFGATPGQRCAKNFARASAPAGRGPTCSLSPSSRLTGFKNKTSILSPKSPGLPHRRDAIVARAEERSGGFFSGFIVGGVVCGVLGFLYAPQISRALLDEHERLRLPFLKEQDPEPVTKDELVVRLNELNQAVDRLTADIGAEGNTAEPAPAPATENA